MNARDVYTIQEAAECLGVSDDTLYRMIRNGSDLPVIRIGGRMKVPRMSFERWLNRPLTHEPQEAAPPERAAA